VSERMPTCSPSHDESTITFEECLGHNDCFRIDV
ncbi:hypothetical protein CR201_G0048173, partial [Pongo abelii]